METYGWNGVQNFNPKLHSYFSPLYKDQSILYSHMIFKEKKLNLQKHKRKKMKYRFKVKLHTKIRIKTPLIYLILYGQFKSNWMLKTNTKHTDSLYLV